MKALLKKKRNSFSEKVKIKTKGIKGLFYKICMAINLLLVAALLFSYLSVFINPAVVAFPALFGLAYPYLLLLNIIMILFWAAFRKMEAFISVAAIIVGIGYFNDFIRLRNHGVEVKTDIKMISYNVRLFNYYESKNSKGSEKKILNLIKKEDPQIVCLQEYYYAGNETTSEQYIKNTLGGRWYSHTKIISKRGNKGYGIITLSRFPIIKRGEIIHPKSSSLTIYSDIVSGQDTIRIYNNHLQSFHLRKLEKTFFEEISGEAEGSFKRIGYFYRRLVDGFKTRALQAEKVKKDIVRSPYPVIVSGDFNDTPISYTYRKIKRGLNDAFVDAGYGAGYTYKGKYPANRIDFIFYNDRIECTDFDIIKIRLSDHYPVVAYFRKLR